MRKLSSKLALGVLAAICSLSASAMANTIQPILKSVTGSAGAYTYVYDIQITPNNGLQADASKPSGFVIVDFGHVTSASLQFVAGDVTATSDWTGPVVANTGAGALPTYLSGPQTGEVDTSGGGLLLRGIGNLAGISGTDDTTLSNISLRYINVAGLGTTGGQRSLIQLTILSDLTPGTLGIQSISVNTASASAPSGSNNAQTDTFPLATAAVPVPAAAWAGLSTLGGLGLMGAFRKRRTA